MLRATTYYYQHTIVFWKIFANLINENIFQTFISFVTNNANSFFNMSKRNYFFLLVLKDSLFKSFARFFSWYSGTFFLFIWVLMLIFKCGRNTQKKEVLSNPEDIWQRLLRWLWLNQTPTQLEWRRHHQNLEMDQPQD